MVQKHKKQKQDIFINFDVESFYPPISIELFNDAINYAKSMTNIDDDQLAIIMQSRKTLPFSENDPWVKKTGGEDFDVTMGCNDGAETCETVGIYMLSRLNNIMKRDNIGLYRDDGLGICQNMSKTEIERMKKAIVKIFKDSGLSITIECNLEIGGFS